METSDRSRVQFRAAPPFAARAGNPCPGCSLSTIIHMTTATEEVQTLPLPCFNAPALRVKIRSLMEEAKIIRSEEKRAALNRNLSKNEAHRNWHAQQLASLHEHRTQTVRIEARHTGLTIAMLRGRQYRQAERKTAPGNLPDPTKIAGMAYRFGFRIRLDNESPWTLSAAQVQLQRILAAVTAWLAESNTSDA